MTEIWALSLAFPGHSRAYCRYLRTGSRKGGLALIDDNLEASGVSPRGDTEPEVKIDPPQTELT